jgi:hypothetical protein
MLLHWPFMPEETIGDFKKVVKRECSSSLDHIRLWNVSILYNWSFKEAVDKEFMQLFGTLSEVL